MTTKRGFGSIRRLPSGRYQARYTGPRGRTVTAPRTFAAKVHAEMSPTDTRRGIDPHGSRHPRSPSPSTHRSRSPVDRAPGDHSRARTRDDYQGILGRELLPAFGHCKLSTVNAAAVRAWYAGALADKPTMRAHSYSLLRPIMTTAVADELIEVNPCRIRGAGKSKRVHKIGPATIDEVEAMTAKVARYPEHAKLIDQHITRLDPELAAAQRDYRTTQRDYVVIDQAARAVENGIKSGNLSSSAYFDNLTKAVFRQ
jgi:hypothetical protein